MVILNCPGNSAAYYHHAGFPSNFMPADYRIMEMVNHDFGLLTNGIIVGFDITAQLLLGFFGIKFRVVFDGFDEFVITVYRSIILENIKNKTFLNCLFHRIAVEWPMFNRIAFGKWLAENLKGFVFRRRGEGKIAGITQHFA